MRRFVATRGVQHPTEGGGSTIYQMAWAGRIPAVEVGSQCRPRHPGRPRHIRVSEFLDLRRDAQTILV